MKTSKNYTIENYRGYGKITVPKGTELTHKTALGNDPKYHFVNEFSWIDTNYPTIANILKMDVSTYGIDVPAEYVEQDFYKVYKLFRKSTRREVLRRNLTREEAQMVVNSYKNSSRSMMVFEKQNSYSNASKQ